MVKVVKVGEGWFWATFTAQLFGFKGLWNLVKVVKVPSSS